MKRTSLRKTAIFAALAALPAFGGNPAAAQDDEIVLGLLNPMTGVGADLGIAAQQGAEPVIEAINAAGGINGKKVRVVFRDTESNPQKAVVAAQELIQRQQIDVLLGCNLTNVALAVIPIVNQAKVPFIVFGTGAGLIDPAKYPYTFRTNMHTDLEAETLVSYALKAGYSKPALLADTTGLGQSGLAELQASLERHGVKPVANEPLNMADTDLTGTVLRLQKSGADVILGWSNGGILAQVARAAERMGFDVPGFAGAGLHQEAFVDLAGDAGKDWAGTYYRAFSHGENGDDASPEVKQFIKDMEARYGSNLTKTIYIAALWHDTLTLLFDALKRADSLEPDAVKAALEQTQYTGMIGDFIFGEGDHDGWSPKSIAVAYPISDDFYIRRRVKELP